MVKAQAFILRCKNSIIRHWKEYRWKSCINSAAKKEKQLPTRDELVIFDTSIHSLNMGDSIIQYYCDKVIHELFPEKDPIRIQTHELPNADERKNLPGAQIKLVCGTNIITPYYEEYSGWKMPDDLYGYQGIITLGVGWAYYCDDISDRSRRVYRTILSKSGLHSVRDSYTEQKFREMGIYNVMNTGCPTLWGLKPEHCAAIPTHKAKNVITTITDYDRDIDCDRLMLKILLEEYEHVSVWIQGIEDLDYLKELIDIRTVEIIPRDLASYTTALCRGNVDYVGTRLHAGIHALNQYVRSLIVAIDNRAIEMGKDTGLPLILRENIGKDLAEKIWENRTTKINLPQYEIDCWKQQFKRTLNYEGN